MIRTLSRIALSGASLAILAVRRTCSPAVARGRPGGYGGGGGESRGGYGGGGENRGGGGEMGRGQSPSFSQPRSPSSESRPPGGSESGERSGGSPSQYGQRPPSGSGSEPGTRIAVRLPLEHSQSEPEFKQPERWGRSGGGGLREPKPESLASRWGRGGGCGC